MKFGTVCCSLVQLDEVWYSLLLFGTIWCSLVQFILHFFGTVWQSLVCVTNMDLTRSRRPTEKYDRPAVIRVPQQRGADSWRFAVMAWLGLVGFSIQCTYQHMTQSRAAGTCHLPPPFPQPFTKNNNIKYFIFVYHIGIILVGSTVWLYLLGDLFCLLRRWNNNENKFFFYSCNVQHLVRCLYCRSD